jgi:predicted permease
MWRLWKHLIKVTQLTRLFKEAPTLRGVIFNAEHTFIIQVWFVHRLLCTLLKLWIVKQHYIIHYCNYDYVANAIKTCYIQHEGLCASLLYRIYSYFNYYYLSASQNYTENLPLKRNPVRIKIMWHGKRVWSFLHDKSGCFLK